MIKQIGRIIDKYILYNMGNKYPSLYRFYDRTFQKIYPYINLIKYKDKHFFHSVDFEISTYCNRKCWYCPNKYNETPKEYMNWEIFTHVIDELVKIRFSGVIFYHLYNEPLFDERLKDFVAYTTKKLPNAMSVLGSNGDLLTVEKAKELLDAGMYKFLITVHGDNPEKNLERLKPVKEFLKEKMVLQTSAQLELVNRGGLIDISKAKNKFKPRCNSIKNLVIKKNGDVILCCQDYYGKHVMGNVMKEGLLEIWNNYSDLRKELLEKNIAKLDICKKCLEIEDKING